MPASAAAIHGSHPSSHISPSSALSAAAFRALVGVALIACLAVCRTARFRRAQHRRRRRNRPTHQSRRQQLPRVTTTVVVHGEVKDDYLPRNDGGQPGRHAAEETPLSVTVVTRAVLNDQVARVLSDVVKNDASVGEDYAPVGYYGDFEIRGFPIDLATGLQINGMTIAGEQDVPLENKESVEFVKGHRRRGERRGLGGRADQLRDQGARCRAASSHRPGHGSSRNFVRRARCGPHLSRESSQPGIRLNLAGEDMHTYVQHADGWRGVGAADGELQFGPATNLFADFEYQHKVQRSEAGYQLLGGTTVPTHVFPFDDAGLSAVGQAEHVRHVQCRRAAGAHIQCRLGQRGSPDLTATRSSTTT